jgi:hypothetical protein
MEAYIRNNVKGYYIEFNEELDANVWNGKIGTTYQDFLDNKWIHLSSAQVEFHVEHPYATIKEVLDCQLTPAPERTLEQAKSEKIQQIKAYDDSSAVNGFTINGELEGWLTPGERSNYRSSIEAAKRQSVPELSFYVGDLPLTVTPAQGEYMLDQVQLYADACAIVTKQHELAVNALDSIEAVDSYDYQTGYPNKPNFTYPIEVS